MTQRTKYEDQNDWDNEISPITLTMKKGTWEVFKSLTPRNTKLNDAVVKLIHQYINDNTDNATDEEIKQWIKDQEFYDKKRNKKVKNNGE